MFRKIVSHLSYSPALIESLSNLALRLKQEEYLRRLGLFFLGGALLLQLLIGIFPPQQSNMANRQDSIYGGFHSLNDFLATYDRNDYHLRDAITSLGITRDTIKQAKKSSLDSLPKTPLYRVSLTADDSAMPSQSFTYPTSGDIMMPQTQVAYLSKLAHPLTTPHANLYTGTAATVWFGIDMTNGGILLQSAPKNLALSALCPLTLPSPTSRCQDFYQQTVYNQTKNQSTSTKANEDDHLLYTFTAHNPSTSPRPITTPLRANLYDVLEYGSLLESSGGTFDSQRGTITWPEVTLQPGESTSRTAIVIVSHNIPATGRGKSNPSSYDCSLSSYFMTTTTTTPLTCPPMKQLEATIAELPPMTPLMLLGEVIGILIIIGLYARSRQLKEEVRLIRHDLNSGAID